MDVRRSHRRASGDFLLSLVFLASLAALLLNDFALKRLTPGPISGKVSDLVGPIVASLVCVALVETSVRLVAPTRWARTWWFALAAGVVLVLMGFVKLTSVGANLYVAFTNWATTLPATAATYAGWDYSPVRASVVMDAGDVLAAALSVPVVIWVGATWRGKRSWGRYLSETVTPPLKSES